MTDRKTTILHNLRRTMARSEFWFLGIIPIVLVAAVLFLVAGRSQAEDVIRVSLNETSEVSSLPEISGTASGQYGDGSLRAAIAGVLSPTKTLEHYQDLLSYMGQQLNQEVKLFLKPTYAEINDLVRGERVDVAFVCSLAYVEGNQDFGMELLVAPQMYGETVYYSYLIVPAASTATSLSDLKSASFAFTDPLSNSGHLAPTYQLSLLEEVPVSFFGNYIFTYSHDNSIATVASKLVDAAAVDSLIYDQMVEEEPVLATKVKVIARWGPYGIPPVVVNPALNSQLKQQLRNLFIHLHESDEGSKILGNLNIEKFVIVPDAMYDSIREIKMKLEW